MELPIKKQKLGICNKYSLHPSPKNPNLEDGFWNLCNHQQYAKKGEDLNLAIGQPLEDPIDEAPMNLHTQGDHGSFMEILFEKAPLFERSSTSMLLALLMLLN
jgi:hypothetical protein